MKTKFNNIDLCYNLRKILKTDVCYNKLLPLVSYTNYYFNFTRNYFDNNQIMDVLFSNPKYLNYYQNLK